MITYTDLYQFECDVQEYNWQVATTMTGGLATLVAYRNKKPIAKILVYMN